MKKISNIAAYLFIASIFLMTTISILGVWDFLSGDVIYKSFQTVSLLALVTLIILLANKFIDRDHTQTEEDLAAIENFKKNKTFNLIDFNCFPRFTSFIGSHVYLGHFRKKHHFKIFGIYYHNFIFFFRNNHHGIR